MQAYYDHKPSIYEAVGNGSYIYRWDIKEIAITSVIEDGDKENKTQWSCQEVTIWSPVSCNGIIKAVLADKWDNDHEQKFINEYNSAQMGLYDDDTTEAAIAAYKEFLVKRTELKTQVENDCKDLNIL